MLARPKVRDIGPARGGLDRSAASLPRVLWGEFRALQQYELPMGAFCHAAIYSEHSHHIGILRRVLLRMAAWMNYVFPLH
jgi:hypothetical protein